jgi:cytochrome d ubiquinol oxidase subunit II
MMTMFGDPEVWLPLAFAALMGFSILIYVILDGFDLGVGVLSAFVEPAERDRMIASIGPFWDANETWLVMAIGILLVAFPTAHGAILTALYIPVAVMLIGLILRGVAFEFRAKTTGGAHNAWNAAFFSGSLLSSLSQGWMLGIYVMGLEHTAATMAFAALTAFCLTGGYAFIGACWLILKTEGALQDKAVDWAKGGLRLAVAGLLAISVATPLVSPRLLDKWFSFPEFLFLAPLPIVSAGVAGAIWLILRDPDLATGRLAWTPFAGAAALFALGFMGMAYSFYPYVVPEQITIYEAASAPESLLIIFVGAVIVMPVIMAYTALAYYIFRGKARALSYE